MKYNGQYFARRDNVHDFLESDAKSAINVHKMTPPLNELDPILPCVCILYVCTLFNNIVFFVFFEVTLMVYIVTRD